MTTSEKKLGDVRINGDGAVAGGTVGNVVINGAGSITSDMEANALRINGAGSADGDVSAKTIVVNGQGTFRGAVHVEEMTVNGDASINAGLGVGTLKATGNVSIGGGVAAHDIKLKGLLRVGGDCDAETFDGDGAFEIGGLFNAGTIDLRLYGPSKAREIGCERITVRNGKKIPWFWVWTEKALKVDTIEGDDISLEYTKARVVRGKAVTVGDGCVVDLVEYSHSYSRVGDAQVGEARKIDSEEATTDETVSTGDELDTE
ncbi:MAG: polymer-forming cytoskeletal protein [Coriobacteriales bacterium]|nr:polymer-forming cytoskeletal protein [Coriobacteriales bacterium]